MPLFHLARAILISVVGRSRRPLVTGVPRVGVCLLRASIDFIIVIRSGVSGRWMGGRVAGASWREGGRFLLACGELLRVGGWRVAFLSFEQTTAREEARSDDGRINELGQALIRYYVTRTTN